MFTAVTKLLGTTLAVVAFSFAIAAQSVFPPALDLETAVTKALDANPQAKIASEGEKLADAAIREAKTGRSPFAQFTSNVTRSNNPVFVFGSLLEQGRFRESNFSLGSLNKPDGLFNFRSAVNFRQPILDQKQTFSRVKIATTVKTQSELASESVRQQLRFEVVRNFYGAMLAREMLKVSDEAVRSADANRKKTKDMVDVGMTTDADYLAADVEFADANQQKLESESNVALSRAALNTILGNEPEKDFEIRGELTERFFPTEDQATLIRFALDNRPDYKRALLDAENGRERLRAEVNKKLPEVSAFGSFGYSSPYLANGSTDYAVGVSLSYTLFDAGRKARTEAAATNVTIAGLETENLAAQIKLEVVRAAQDFSTSRARIQVSVKAIAQAEEALRIIQDRYKFGLTTFNEVLRGESALVRAKHNLLTARYRYFVSFAAVLLATGRLTDTRAFN